MRSAKATSIPVCALLALGLAAGCSDGGGDPTDGGHGQTCGDQYCASTQTCVNESMCVSTPDRSAEAFEEIWSGEGDERTVDYQSRGLADLSCHNAQPCTASTDCPSDAAGVQLVCRDGFCGLPAPADGPATVTFRGCVDAFGIGDVTEGVQVALFTADQDPTGTPTSGWQVTTTQDKVGCEYWGTFEFEDVPTNTPLILRVSDENELFITTYKYNLVLWSDLAVDEGNGPVFDTRTVVNDPRTGQDLDLNPWRGYAISSTTYAVILMAVGISNLPETQGAVAGTIRDCSYLEVKNVRCAVVDKPTSLTYFTDSENPRPDQSLDASNANGIYAAIGIEAGHHRVSCLAEDQDGNLVPLGEYPVQVFPHGATILSMDWYPGVD